MMHRKAWNLFAVCAFAAVFTACGDETNTTVVNETTGIFQLAEGEALPDCDSLNAGEMLFVADSGRVYYCASGTWQTLNGKDGSDGADGKDGENGASGESSVDTVLVRDTVIVSKLDSVLVSKTDTVVLSKTDTLVVLDSGLNGTSCTAEALENGSGYKILCGGDSVGVLLNGADGAAGASCSLSDDGAGTVTVTCGGSETKLYKAFCGTEPYDPEKKLCDSRDGQTYKRVVIGTQTWMAENLNYNYNTGTAASYCYENSADSCTKYGRLYTWAAAMDSAAVFSTSGKGCGYGKTCTTTKPVHGVCPEGWHLPDSTEWATLENYVDANNGSEGVGTSLKSTSGWESGNGTDLFGFSTLPAGDFLNDGSFDSAGRYAHFWCALGYSGSNAYALGLNYGVAALYVKNYHKGRAFSVRCLKD